MAQPFVYSPYSSPQSGTIAELMLQRGAIDANRATAVANAVAQNQRANGQIAGGIAQAIGQGVGAISQVPEQQRQLAETQKRQAMADEANQLELNDRKAAAKSRNTIEAALADQSNYKPDGTPDDDKITAFLRKNDVGAAQLWQKQSEQALKSRMDLLHTASEIAASDATAQEKTQAAQKVRTEYLGSQAYDAIRQLNDHPDDAMHIRDAMLGRAGADKMISPEDFRALSMQLASAKPEQLKSVFETFVPGDMKSKLDKEYADTAQSQAAAAKNNAEVAGTMAVTPEQRSQIDLRTKQIEEIDAKLAGNEPLTSYQKQELQIQRDRLHNENETADPKSDKNQQKFEQEYRTVLQRAIGTRTGGLGLEDQKVNQANHLTSLLDQFYNAKTGTWDIPRVQLNELALGLARLTSPGGQAGEGMLKEFQQRTAKGDIAGALTYLTGQPVASNTQAITAMLKDSIERQGKTAEQNRQGGLDYLRGLVPTDLNEDRRQQLESTSMTPLRQSRVASGPNGQKKLFVSVDGGKTWQ